MRWLVLRFPPGAWYAQAQPRRRAGVFSRAFSRPFRSLSIAHRPSLRARVHRMERMTSPVRRTAGAAVAALTPAVLTATLFLLPGCHRTPPLTDQQLAGKH